jgi:Bacterial capsule synthesis protein PGA_cap
VQNVRVTRAPVTVGRERPRRRRGLAVGAATACAVAFALGACGTGTPSSRSAAELGAASERSSPAGRTAPAASAAGEASPTARTPTAPSPTSRPRSGGGRAVLAFAGDVHFEGSAARALSGHVGSAFTVLRSADLAVLNLETAVTDRGTAQPKEFTFRAPAAAFGVLERSGVDAVTIANNHGMDYGRVGLADTLAAARRYGMPLLGAGVDDTAAWTPLRREIHGVRISVIGATDVLDDFAVSSWVAGPGKPGLASAKTTSRLLAAVGAERPKADVVVVFLHWGRERNYCPTSRQIELAQRLAAAGADVVVGSHAHVVEPGAHIGHTVVKYGLGNFQFYSGGGLFGQSGVFTVPVTRAGAGDATWHPANVLAGAPMLLTGSAASARDAEETRRFASC